MTNPPNKLTAKQAAFVEHYLQSWNGAEAARRAGYAESTVNHSLHTITRQPAVAAAIQQRLAELKLDADEVLARLGQHARADIADFISLTPGGADFDLRKAIEGGNSHLIKRARKVVRGGEFLWEIELHDAQAALDKLMRHLGQYDADHKFEVDFGRSAAAQLDKLIARLLGEEDGEQPDGSDED